MSRINFVLLYENVIACSVTKELLGTKTREQVCVLSSSCPQYPQPKVVLARLRGDGAGAGARGGGRAGAAPAAAVPLLRGHGGRGGAEAGGRQGDPARGDRAHRCQHHCQNSSPHHCYPRQTRRSSSAPPRAACASCAAPAAAASWRAARAAATWSAAAARSTRPRSAPASPGSATHPTCSTSSCPSGEHCIIAPLHDSHDII